jgi:hypothetical protein
VTFLELQNAVLERFSDANARPNAKRWINLFGAALYHLESWTFRLATDDVTTAVASIDVTGEVADIDEVIGVWSHVGDRLRPLSPGTFYENYQPGVAVGESGTPEAYTVLDGQLQVGPAASEVATYRLLYMRRWTELVEDTDVPDFPAGFHWMLAAGAMAVGQAHSQDPMAALLDPVVSNGVQALRQDYLSDVREVGEQWAADPLGT